MSPPHPTTPAWAGAHSRTHLLPKAPHHSAGSTYLLPTKCYPFCLKQGPGATVTESPPLNPATPNSHIFLIGQSPPSAQSARRALMCRPFLHCENYCHNHSPPAPRPDPRSMCSNLSVASLSMQWISVVSRIPLSSGTHFHPVAVPLISLRHR